MTSVVWLRQYWYDEALVWNSTDFWGISYVNIPSNEVWLPDTVLYNSVGNDHNQLMTNVVINSAGYVTWMAPRVFRSSCNIDIYYFPFDDQKCLLEFGSWTYGGYDVNTTTESVPPSLTYFVHNDEWVLLDIGDKQEDIYYVCCPEPYPLVTFTIYVRRRSMYYLIFLVSPCLLFSIMTILGFYLPPEAGERVGLGITVLLAFTVFLLMVSELMPPTSSAVPLIGKSHYHHPTSSSYVITVLLAFTVFLLMVSELMPPTSSAVPLIGKSQYHHPTSSPYVITVLLAFTVFLLMVSELMPPTSSAVSLSIIILHHHTTSSPYVITVLLAFTVFLLMESELMPPTSSAVSIIILHHHTTSSHYVITVLLAFTVFLLMVSELMPPTSSAVPLIGKSQYHHPTSSHYVITVLLAFTVFLLMVSELMPPTSSAVPLIGKSQYHHPTSSYYVITYVITVLLAFTVFLLMVSELMPPTSSAVSLSIIILHHRTTSSHYVITVLLAFTVFLLMVSELMPPTSSAVPLIVCYYGVTIMLLIMDAEQAVFSPFCYYGVTIMLVMFATFMTILILNLHHTDPSCRPVPPWVRCAFLHGLGRVFCTRPHRTAAPPGVDVSLSNCTELEFLCEEYENEIRVTSPDNGKNKKVEDAHACPERYAALLRALRMLMRELHHHVMKCQQMSAANESRDNDWKRVARVLDKLCVALFTFTTVVTAVAVLLKVPHINL
ncbi:CHRNA7 [Branchiostoma lanceolatum]|uniref:CHRNA7 protein n=1 Tax=Branchiostoma lanceolatum TaxID=7740 RepID=A0A8J9YNT7_BRALA|nr:CHRNA7 [Branchiostoma lanceolatum]